MNDQKAIVITIDGPAGTGKSTVARRLAARLGLYFLDTGAMYRAATVIALDEGSDPSSEADRVRLVEAVSQADLHFDWRRDPPEIMAFRGGGFVGLAERIRVPEVAALVSRVSAIAELRHHLVRKQRIIAHQHPGLVTEGRDQGSVVFADAPVKFFLDADPRVRAARRSAQLAAAGEQVTDAAEMLRSIMERDRLDSTREEGPLRVPDGAEVIDTSSLEIDAVTELLERRTIERLARLGLELPGRRTTV